MGTLKYLRSQLPLFLLSLYLTTFTASHNAQALSLKGQGWIGLGAANIHQVAPTSAGWWGPALKLGLLLHITDFWQITTDLESSFHPSRTIDNEPAGPHSVAAAALGLRYTFDAFKYIPYAGIAFVAAPLGPPSERAPNGEIFSLRASLGVDYRYNRRISFGGTIQVSAPLTEPQNFPLYSSIGAHMGFHFRKF